MHINRIGKWIPSCGRRSSAFNPMPTHIDRHSICLIFFMFINDVWRPNGGAAFLWPSNARARAQLASVILSQAPHICMRQWEPSKPTIGVYRSFFFSYSLHSYRISKSSTLFDFWIFVFCFCRTGRPRRYRLSAHSHHSWYWWYAIVERLLSFTLLYICVLSPPPPPIGQRHIRIVVRKLIYARNQRRRRRHQFELVLIWWMCAVCVWRVCAVFYTWMHASYRRFGYNFCSVWCMHIWGIGGIGCCTHQTQGHRVVVLHFCLFLLFSL